MFSSAVGANGRYGSRLCENAIGYFSVGPSSQEHIRIGGLVEMVREIPSQFLDVWEDIQSRMIFP